MTKWYKSGDGWTDNYEESDEYAKQKGSPYGSLFIGNLFGFLGTVVNGVLPWGLALVIVVITFIITYVLNRKSKTLMWIFVTLWTLIALGIGGYLMLQD